MRSRKFYTGYYYHICNKSIANFGIFQAHDLAQRFYSTLDYYNNLYLTMSFSRFIAKNEYKAALLEKKDNTIVKFLAYCIMPDHYHSLLKVNDGLKFSHYINNIENSYTRFFNLKFKRKGPLWQSNFRSAHIKNNSQLLHVSRYIHINPTTAMLVAKPEQWEMSSYCDYIAHNFISENLPEISIKDHVMYKKFCDDQIDYQRSLKKIKKKLLE